MRKRFLFILVAAALLAGGSSRAGQVYYDSQAGRMQELPDDAKFKSVAVGTANHKIERDGDDLKFTDPNNPSGVSLGTLAAGAGTDDQTATEVPNTPAGNIAATNVQAAINELDNEKQAVVSEGSLPDSVIVSADIKDGTVAAADVAADVATQAEIDLKIGYSGTPEVGQWPRFSSVNTCEPLSDAAVLAAIGAASTSTKLDDFGTPDDNTDLNVSTSAHGLCPKLPDNAAVWLDGTGNYSAPGGSGDVTAASSFATDNVLVRSDGTGKGVQATGISVADTTNNVTGMGTLGCGAITATGTITAPSFSSSAADGSRISYLPENTSGNEPTPTAGSSGFYFYDGGLYWFEDYVATSHLISDLLDTNDLGTGVETASAIALSGAGGLTTTVASGTSALGTSEIASGACATVVTTAATNTAATDVINWGFNSDPTSTTGYSAGTSGMLTIIAYPSANNVNFLVCNNTASAITPGAVTLNWRVNR